MIGFVIAMEREAEILLRHMKLESDESLHGKRLCAGTAFGKPVALAIGGIGKVNAAAATECLLLRFPIRHIVNFGVAGGLNASLKLGGVYPISHSVEYDFDLSALNGTPIGTPDEYKEPYLPLTVPTGFAPAKRLATADRFNDSRADYLLLTETLRADIRDMEGGAIVHAAARAGVPVSAFKAISDLAGSGSTTEQYLRNTAAALAAMEAALARVVEAI